uniref:Uncharacterized protein n=1 Tax=Ditylenchus dipsaci TaxID=166011 RepID=A0A915DVL7_9BILA
MDRYSVAGVLTRIQQYFDITDTQAGLLQTTGTIANGLYIFVIPPSTGCSGIGEASYSILAPTLIADLFISNARSRAIMFFYFAVPVGSGLGYVIGSAVATAFDDWKWGIRVTPILGLISIIAVIILIEEPERGQAEKEAKVKSSSDEKPKKDLNSTYLDDLKYLIKIKTYIWSTVGYTAVVFVSGTLAWWAPSAIDYALAMQQNLNNTTELDPAQKDKVSAIFGALTCIGGIIGVATGTYLAHIWKEGKFCFKNCASPKADPLISGIGALVTIFFSVTFVSLNVAINVDMLMYIIVPKRRAVANSWQITMSHLFGDASGPSVIGLISDFLRKHDESPSAHYYSLRTAFYAPTVILIIAGLAYIICAFTLSEDLKNYKRDMGKKMTRMGISMMLPITKILMDLNK